MTRAAAEHADALFISPHFDDVALSCGGTVAGEARLGRALVLTVFAGQPAEALSQFAEFQHRRWGGLADAVDARRREDVAAMGQLGAAYQWLDFPDAIYRGDLYRSDADLFGEVKPPDEPIERAVSDAVLAAIAVVGPRRVYLPLAVGHHVDHQICFAVAPMIASDDRSVCFYEDFPYAAGPGAVEARLADLPESLAPIDVDVSETIAARLAAISCYASQLPTIFRDYGPAEEVVRRYAGHLGEAGYGERFWTTRPPAPSVEARRACRSPRSGSARGRPGS